MRGNTHGFEECECEKPTTSSKSALNVGLCHNTVEECAKLLDEEADRMERAWNVFLKSGNKGPATTFHTVPREYAKMLRQLVA